MLIIDFLGERHDPEVYVKHATKIGKDLVGNTEPTGWSIVHPPNPITILLELLVIQYYLKNENMVHVTVDPEKVLATIHANILGHW